MCPAICDDRWDVDVGSLDHIGLGRTLVVKGTNKIFVLIPMYVLRVFYGYLKTYLSQLKVIVL
jgi:hypothetical protein